MRRLPGQISNLGLMTIAVLSAAGIAIWAADFGARSATSSDAAPADDFAMRFPPAFHEATQLAPAWLAVAGGANEQQLALFNPHPTYPAMAASFTPETAASTGTTASAATAANAATATATQRNANRKPTVFNDAQIASIKKRLNLSRDQEEYWPAVEAMLRRLAWKKTPDNARGKAIPLAERRLAELDVSSADLQRLQSTTGALLMSFNQDQKRELQMLAHLVGLQDAFSKF